MIRKLHGFILFLLLSTYTFAQVANQPSNIELCDVDNDGTDTVNLTINDSQILGSQPVEYFSVTYYETQIDAESGENTIVNPNNYSVSNTSTTIYARVFELSTGNFDTTSFNIQLFSIPVLNDPTPLQICDDESNDGIEIFDLNEAIQQITDDLTLSITFHETLADAENFTNSISNPNIYINLDRFQTLYVRVLDILTGCYATTTLNLMVLEYPSLTIAPNYVVCEGDVLVIDTEPSGTYNYILSLKGVVIGSSSRFLTIPETGTYELMIEDLIAPCTTTITFEVTFINCEDIDDDGVMDEDEDLNANNDLADDDTDGDEIPNYLDDDDDGDNVDTLAEISSTLARSANTSHNFVDTDGDNIENYLDDDDDGDGVLTVDEDYNNNGDPTDDDTNTNGIPDYLDDLVALGVDEFKQIDFKIYPNPALNKVTIQIDNGTTDYKIEIFDIVGKAVISNIISKTQNIDISQLKSGLYFIKLSKDSVSSIERLIIK